MKRILIAAAISLTAFQATAGSVTFQPPAAVEIESPERMGGSGAWIVPLVIVAVIALAVSKKNEEEVILVSDRRLKTDIDRIGTAPNGLPLYSYRYIGLSQVHTGVMAQDVLAHTPEAVVNLPFGLMAVNYSILGITPDAVN